MRGLNTKCQLENKQLENVHFLSSYLTMSSYLCLRTRRNKDYSQFLQVYELKINVRNI
jgi:hypothetical protein